MKVYTPKDENTFEQFKNFKKSKKWVSDIMFDPKDEAFAFGYNLIILHSFIFLLIYGDKVIYSEFSHPILPAQKKT